MNNLVVATETAQRYEPSAPPVSEQPRVLSTMNTQRNTGIQQTQELPTHHMGALYQSLPQSAMTQTQIQYQTCMNVGNNPVPTDSNVVDMGCNAQPTFIHVWY